MISSKFALGAIHFLSIVNFATIILHQVSANPPLLPEEDTQLGFEGLYDVHHFNGKPHKDVTPGNPNFEALEYRINAKINLNDTELSKEERFTAPSSIRITVNCIRSTDTIILNANTVNSILVILHDTVEVINERTQESILPVNSDYTESDEIFVINLPQSLQEGETYVIYMKFIATILHPSKHLDGLYFSHYEEDNQTKYLAVTQFQAEGARKMFPCFDEPSDKANFTISVGRLEKYNSISNMEIVRTEPMEGNPGWYWDHFGTTPLMSTYLAAIVVSEFDCATADPNLFRGLSVKVCGAQEEIKRGGGDYGADKSARILNYYEEHLKIEYPFPKMASAAIPHFAAGAMENWGINTYRISALLYFPGETPESQKEGITSVIAHELGHQWFGNLVTCRTWNQIWLNEGFATYIEYYGVDAVSKEFEPLETWFADTFQRALKADEKDNSHPIVNMTQSHGNFDAITYQKGASVIFMMGAILTEKCLLLGLQRYLREKAYGSADQWELFNILEDESMVQGCHPGKNFTEVMNTWTLQTGFPIIYVQEAFENRYYVYQERFIATDTGAYKVDNEIESTNSRSSTWYINLHFVTSRNPDFTWKRSTVWLSNNHSRLLWTAPEENNEWVLLNAGTVFGRVLYSDSIAMKIVDQLNKNFSVIGTKNRAQVIDDYFTLAYSKRYNVNIETALEFTRYIGSETERIVWLAVMTQLRKPFLMLAPSEQDFNLFKEYLLPHFSKAFESIPENVSGGSKVILRANFMNWMVGLEDPTILEYSLNLVRQWKNQENVLDIRIPVDIRSAVLCGAAATGDKEVWNFILETSQVIESQRNTLLSSLACTKDMELLLSLLEKTLNPTSEIPKKYAASVLNRITENSVGRKIAFEFIQKNFDKIIAYYGGAYPIAVFVNSAAKSWSSDDELQALTNFVDEHADNLKSIINIVNSAKNLIIENREWMRSFQIPIRQWIKNEIQRSPEDTSINKID